MYRGQLWSDVDTSLLELQYKLTGAGNQLRLLQHEAIKGIATPLNWDAVLSYYPQEP